MENNSRRNFLKSAIAVPATTVIADKVNPTNTALQDLTNKIHPPLYPIGECGLFTQPSLDKSAIQQTLRSAILDAPCPFPDWLQRAAFEKAEEYHQTAHYHTLPNPARHLSLQPVSIRKQEYQHRFGPLGLSGRLRSRILQRSSATGRLVPVSPTLKEELNNAYHLFEKARRFFNYRERNQGIKNANYNLNPASKGIY